MIFYPLIPTLSLIESSVSEMDTTYIVIAHVESEGLRIVDREI